MHIGSTVVKLEPMSCNINDIIQDIRKSLNECTPSGSENGCGCNDRYSDADILSSINSTILSDIVANHGYDFVQDVTITVPAGECRVNICEAGCDAFVSFGYPTNDPCFIPEEVCLDEIGNNIESHPNPCFSFSTSTVEDDVIYQYYHNPKTPCVLVVDREDNSLASEAVINCMVYPDPFELGDELPEVLCNKYRSVIYHNAIFHLIDRDHRPTQEYLLYATMHRDTGTSRLRDIMNADRNLYSSNYLGEDIEGEKC